MGENTGRVTNQTWAETQTWMKWKFAKSTLYWSKPTPFQSKIGFLDSPKNRTHPFSAPTFYYWAHWFLYAATRWCFVSSFLLCSPDQAKWRTESSTVRSTSWCFKGWLTELWWRTPTDRLGLFQMRGFLTANGHEIMGINYGQTRDMETNSGKNTVYHPFPY